MEPRRVPPRPQVARNVATPAGRTLILGDDSVINLRYRTDLVQEFPFLRAPIPVTKQGCKKCGVPVEDRLKKAMAANAIKLAILSLAPERLKRLKTLLGTDRLEMYVRTPSGVERRDA